MQLFCPICGRLTRFNPELVGVTPKVCPCCVFDLEQGIRTARPTAHRTQTSVRLRLFGYTLVRN